MSSASERIYPPSANHLRSPYLSLMRGRALRLVRGLSPEQAEHVRQVLEEDR